MSNKTELQSNNVDLQAILATVNALPDAGSGGGTPILFTGVEGEFTCNKTYDECVEDYTNLQFAAYLTCDELDGMILPVSLFTYQPEMGALVYGFYTPEVFGAFAFAVMMTPDGIMVEAQ